MFEKLSPEQRSVHMRTIRSKHTRPELLVRHFLDDMGIPYFLHEASLPGKPDIVLPSRQTVIFVQGCFWHWHGEACGIRPGKPRANQAYWEPKLAGNVARDEQHRLLLEAAGWRVLTVWECELRKKERGATLHRLLIDILTAEEAASEWLDGWSLAA
jgi:DNA mismatch endonuclease (patch repair protein)